MNVVQREKRVNKKTQSKSKNELVRKDLSIGIRGINSLLPAFSYNSTNVSRPVNTAPRYQFNNEASSSKPSMGPPLGTPRSTRRKTLTNSSSAGGAGRARVLAGDSAPPDTTQDFTTPKNRPTALRYISSSSRGGYSGTRSARSTSTSVIDASVILAISEGRGMARGEVGMAAVDLRHPHLVLCQFSDTLLYTHTLTKINYFNPVEIIVPHTFCEGVQPSQLYRQIRDHYPLVNLTTVQRRHFNDAAGRQQIQTLCAPQYSAVYLQVLQKFYALTAAAAVLKYVEYIQCIVFARESLKIEYHSSENTMIIDVGTATQLELVQPLVPSAGLTCCLLGVLGPSYTVGGSRALRAAILQPSCQLGEIEARLDAVQDLIENDSGLMTGLQDVIKKLSDVDKILFLCVDSPHHHNLVKQGEGQLNQTILLKTTMDAVPKIVEALNVAESGRLRKIKLDFENLHYTQITERIRAVIQDDAHLEKGAMGSLQRCFAVKPNINGLLDVARRTYSELIEDIQKVVERLGEAHDLPIRLHQNMMRGFHVVLPLAPKNRRTFNLEDLPPVFIQVQNNGASVSMTTEDLVVMDQQAKESLNEIQKMSNIVIAGLLKDLRPFMSSLYKLCENVAELDILLALAQASTIGSYIRPEFSTYLDVRNSVHPLLDYNTQVMPVPNDISASPEHNFTIITGPNMGGKSIYIKQIAFMQIMAQLGCFLPATKAVLRLCDRMFSRIGFNDSVELNASTYVFEMKEMQHILKELTPSSLVIIDELCRGTSAEEGTSMAWAVCEELVASDAFTFFTTHFMYLTRLQDLYFNVVNRHTAVTEEQIAETQSAQSRLVYQHKIEPGTSKIEHYGLTLAARTNLPEGTVSLARELAVIIAKRKRPQEIMTPQRNDEAVLYKLNAEIRLESRKQNSDATIRQMLRKFKEDHPLLMERLRVERSRSNRPNSSANLTSTFDGRRLNFDSNEIVSSANVFDSRRIYHNMNKQATVLSDFTRRDTSKDTRQESSKNRPRPESSEDSRKRQTDDEIRGAKEPQNLQTFFSSATNTDSDETNAKLNKSFPQKSPNDTNERNKSFIDNEDEMTEDNHFARKDNKNYTSVKSSTELLISLINNDYSMEEMTTQNDQSSNIKTNSTKRKITNDFNNNSSNNDDSENVNEIIGNDEAMMIDDDIIGVSDNSDVADELTQIIEEQSLEEIESSDDTDSDSMSVDQVLVMETVAEIHEDLASRMMNFENIVLTPPMDFRD